ncbi:MAG TPA: hypothetical protein VLX92_20840 [Kofleriaceae bacterium]|nr:hypothetical protein [Kofleriaceae bacterium]
MPVSALVLVLALAACGSSSEGPHVMMDFTRAKSLFDAPFPSDDLMAGSAVDPSVFPDPDNTAPVEQARALLATNSGFATTGGVFFQISTALDPTSLPGIADSAAADSPTFVAAIDPSAPDYGVRYPLEVTFEPTGTMYGAPNLLALLPVSGLPLRPGERYAAIVTTAVTTDQGKPLARAPHAALARFPDAVTALPDLGVSEDDVAGITAFTTGDATLELAKVRSAALAAPLPAIDAPFALTDTFADFCAFHTTIAMPDYQSGTPPFSSEGGEWTYDSTGAPILQRMDESDLVLTVPTTPPPPGGYPLIVFVRTGGGGDRPLVDRGQQPAEGAPAIEPGEGPARYFARAGFAGIEVDGPLGGLRNPSGADEEFLVFNITNLGGMRDTIRESAVELDVLAHVAVALHVDTSACAGGSTDVTFDATHVGIMGHSMGAWIAPLAVAYEPLFKVVLLSGAGGSWIENIIFKQKPVAPLSVVTTLLHLFQLNADDPVLTFAQWALEPADPQAYGATIVREPPAGSAPREVLMMQGIVDDYILPRIAQATSLSMGLDLAGPELDTENDPRLAGELALGPLLPLDGRAAIGLPVTSNVQLPGGAVATAVVTQHMEDGIEDGHEVVFQTDPPKHEYQCFLASWLQTGTPSVPTDASRDAPCPAD